jgi:hypothetical protein
MISDPEYARIFTKARCISWSEGYALLLHGTATRDLDLLAVPWTESACDARHLVGRIARACDLEVIALLSPKPHGRTATTLMFKGFNDPRFVDLSVMPTKDGDA